MAQNTKHTPGPWVTDQAAAPDLLAAMTQCAEGLENDARMYPSGNFPSSKRFVNRAASLRAAIAKAT